jgi:uncharacterized phage infection (PIP) family protein YhgE
VRVQGQQLEKSKEAELLAAKATLRETQRQLTDKTRQLARTMKDLDEVKSSVESQLSSVERKYGEETALYRKRSSMSTYPFKLFDRTSRTRALTNNLH